VVDRKHLFGQVIDLLAEFTVDELRVIRSMATRINSHRAQYGGLVIANDDRNHRAERAMEFNDALFYGQLHEVAWEDRRRERLACFSADAIAPALEEFARAGIEEVE
jgi:hypothetical protein